MTNIAGTKYCVVVVNRYMQDFVTSHTAIMIFDTLTECEKYVESSESFHPGRFIYHIKEFSYEEVPSRKV